MDEIVIEIEGEILAPNGEISDNSWDEQGLIQR
jgi:hypothetical protein